MSTEPIAESAPTKRPRRRRAWRLWLAAGLAVAALAAVHLVVKLAVGRYVNLAVDFGSELDERQRQQAGRDAVATLPDAELAPLPEPAPFREIDAFDEAADDWSNFFDSYAAVGALSFDANGDGRLDVYLTHNNNTWTRPTDEQGVLQPEPRIFGNGLYLNRGNDQHGDPIFASVAELAAANPTYVEEELLVENFLYPRRRVDDSTDRVGRTSSIAIAADLDADGRLDLVVGSILPGMLWSHPKTQRVLGQFVRPIGRQAVSSKTPLRAQGIYFLKDYQPNDHSNDLRPSARAPEGEYYGANSVFLNLGDRDGDGLPEWRDVSRETGLEGRRNTLALLATDIDLDGDLDLFEANIMDMDFWPGGSTALAGAANQLYVNQLAETGELRFVERSAELDVDGLYDDGEPVPEYHRLYRVPVLPPVYSVALRRFERYRPEYLEINGERSEPGQISHAAITQDVNRDGYPDIWVANDLGFLRLYINRQGRGFERSMDHPRARQTGYWMTFSAADFDGDLAEDLFIGNMGGATMNLAMPLPDLFALFDPVLGSSTMAAQFMTGSHHSMHSLIDGASAGRAELANKVRHSQVLPPDAALPNNTRDLLTDVGREIAFDPDSLDPYEFAWGSTVIDVQNDGRPDLYWLGCLNGRGGGIFPIIGTGPGRLLVNASRQRAARFVDLTAEHRLFNIEELRYDKLADEGYVYRQAPRQNWGKRSMVYSYDVSVWGLQGLGIVERITNQDLIQTAENGRSVIAADFNGDGFSDLLMRNIGGYDSRGSDSKNLKARIDGRVQVVPAHDANFPSPTNYEPGRTRLFINGYRGANWLKVQLIDDTDGSLNRFAVGAEVSINDRYLQVVRSGGGGFLSNAFTPLLFGLGEDRARAIRVRWPDRRRSETVLELDGLARGLLTVRKSDDAIDWRPGGEGG